MARWPPGGQRSWAPRYLRLVQAGQGATQKGTTQAYNIHKRFSGEYEYPRTQPGGPFPASGILVRFYAGRCA